MNAAALRYDPMAALVENSLMKILNNLVTIET